MTVVTKKTYLKEMVKMKSEWRVCSNPVGGKMCYGVYRLRDVNGIMHSGNMEVENYYDTKKEAQQKAKELNERDAETFWKGEE